MVDHMERQLWFPRCYNHMGSVLEGTLWDVSEAGATIAGWRLVKQVRAPGLSSVIQEIGLGVNTEKIEYVVQSETQN